MSLEVKEESLIDLVLLVKEDNPPESNDPTGQVPGNNVPTPPPNEQNLANQPIQNNNANAQSPDQIDKTPVKEKSTTSKYACTGWSSQG